MKLITLIAVFSLALAPVNSQACMDQTQRTVLIYKYAYFPAVGNTTNHWPEESNLSLGSYVSFLVPKDTVVKVTPLDNDPEEHLKISEPKDDAIPGFKTQVLYEDNSEINYDSNLYHWVHLRAFSVGKAELSLISKTGFEKSVSITIEPFFLEPIYEARPMTRVTFENENTLNVGVSARHDLEVTIPGTINDGWTIASQDNDDFKLVSISLLEEENAPPRVRLFFKGKGYPNGSTIVINRGKGPTQQTYRLNLQALPTPAC